jgi:hypothetical protein
MDHRDQQALLEYRVLRVSREPLEYRVLPVLEGLQGPREILVGLLE